MDSFCGEQEKQAKRLKRKLESWREVLLGLHSLLIWERNWCPAAIFGATSAFYLLLWMLEPPLLALWSSLAILFTLMDFLIPSLVANFFNANSWTKNDEKLYEEICKGIVVKYNRFSNACRSFYNTRETTPKTYYFSLIICLSLLAWLGSTVDNLLLTYFTTLITLLIPGLLFNQYLNPIIQIFTKYIPNKSQ